ncbi:DegT/DnrJ/EryC1/StrS family aminotransferase [Pedococcus bigeumensis]|uniref:Aminotransferase class V-fold PLP-dependent enzyme n=1 Tax=Pedococcus bigeumensis TaxID=433644 RepID=A0A502CZS3_9MICO|nr:aminotransferase class V-fold PLP-dependent enzyme [Pedococcus bigeumensis]TPG18174.1 aminotransferase class V-fold PLP-dependent enzyme [Pedococcus bigeumensis]
MRPLLPYGRHSINEDDIKAVISVLEGGWLTTGPAVDAFESALATQAEVASCISVSSGTAALHTAYAAMRLGSGDEVVTTPMTFVATASTAVALGARVVFADVEEDTANLDPRAAEAAMTSSTRAVAAVDYAGHPAELDALREVAHAGGALLLEDAAHSVGSTYRGRPVGGLADLTTFSFFPTKNLTSAEGGAVLTNHPDLARQARQFRTVGLVRDPALQRHPELGPWHQEVHELGLNYRLADVLCALGNSQLSRLATFRSRRAELVARYQQLLGEVPGLRLPVARPHVDPTWHLYAVRVLEGRRREVYDGLRSAGIGVQVNYLPVYWHPLFEDLGYRRGQCPVAEAFYAEQLSLPLYPDLTNSEQDRVVEELRRVLEG